MLLDKLKVAVIGILTLGVATIGTVLLTRGALREPRTDTREANELREPAQGKPETKVPSPEAAAEPAAPETRPITISGKASGPDGKPVKGATVYLVALNARIHTVGPRGQDTVVATTTTDEQGRYTFRATPLPVIRNQADRPRLANFQVFSTAPGYGLTWQGLKFFSDEPRPPANPNVKAKPPAEDDVAYLDEVVPIDLTFRPAARVQGRVVDEAGKPLGQVKVSLGRGIPLDLARARSNPSSRLTAEIHALPESLRTAVSDKDGRFQFEGAPEDAVLWLLVEHPSYAAMNLRLATTPTSEVPERKKELLERARQRWQFVTGDLALTFAASRQLTLRTVTGDTGQPMAGVAVQVNRIKETTSVWASGETNAAGQVLLRLPPGEYEADIHPPAGSDYVRTLQSVTVTGVPAEQAAAVRVRRGGLLILEVTDADTGKGIPGVAFVQEDDHTPGLMVHLAVSNGQPDYEKDVTDANGKLRAVVPPGKRRYAVDTRRPLPAGYRAAPAEGRPGREVSQNPRIDLAEGQTLTLRFELHKQRSR